MYISATSNGALTAYFCLWHKVINISTVLMIKFNVKSS